MRRLSPIAAFSLLELIVVLFILALLSSVLIYTIGVGDQRRVASSIMQRIQAHCLLAQDTALIRAVTTGVCVSQAAYRLVIFNANSQAWDSLSLDASTHQLPADLHFTLQRGARRIILPMHNAAHCVPTIMFDEAGGVSGFLLTIGHNDQTYAQIDQRLTPW